MKDPMFKIKESKTTPSYGEFVIEPLEPGYGHTVGNALRRVLLTSIPGAAITSVKISGVKHKFSTIPGVKENVIDLLLNIKKLNIRLLDSKKTATINLSVKGSKTVTAEDLELPEDVEIVDKSQYICSLGDKKGKLEIEMTVEKDFGYSLSEDRKISTLGVIPTDAIFTPVRRVNYLVEATRVGRQTNLDKCILQIWTNGSVEPREALDQAAKILASYFVQVYEPKFPVESEGEGGTPLISEDVLRLTVDELDLPTRIYNSLKNGNIETLGQLLKTSKKDLMKMRNMGGKSLAVIDKKLQEKGLSLMV
ncbi:MAG: DNA-directed RNA polymerase subunit alpha [bacterium]|nr:DNA-directed RNA polymerase subunit alpha [bacterium]